tara:strand:+ start:176 stop:526 length:351 start_codon:yes stop_codon:yes gene_type:complete
MIYKISTSKTSFYIQYLSAINGALGLSKKEILILGEFMEIKNSLGKNDALVFSSIMRKKVQTKLGISQHNLNNYVKTLKEKKALILQGDILRINGNIIPIIKDGKYSVTFNFNIIE